MAHVEGQAALHELDKAAHLKDRAQDLLEIAAELEREAEMHEHDALELIAPAKMSSVQRRPGRS